MAGTEEPQQPTEFHKLQAYTKHQVWYHLEANHPYLDDIRSHLAHDEVSTAFGSRLFPRLQELLTSTAVKPPELVEALDMATELVSNQEYKCLAVSAGLCRAVTDLILHSDVKVQRSAVLTLSRIALVLLGRQGLAACGAADRLADLLLSAEDEQVKANVAEAMANFAIANDGCQYLVDRGCVHAIGSHLLGALPNPESTTSAECAVGLLATLRHVAVTAHLGVRDLIGKGVLGKIVQFISKANEHGVIAALGPERTPETVCHALAVLGAVAGDAVGRKELIHADAVETIASCIGGTWPVDVREKAIAGLLALSLEVEGKKRLVAHVDKLVAFMGSGEESTYAQDVCRRLSLSAGELPAFRLEFAQKMLEANAGKQLVAIFGVTVCAPLALILEQTKKLRLRRTALATLTSVLEQRSLATAAPGDRIFVPPMNPDHKGDPVNYTLETCPAIIERLLLLMRALPGTDPEDCKLPLTAVRLLVGPTAGKTEAKRILETKDVRSQLSPEMQRAVDSLIA